jgi:uncharacterized membrane protein (TIGR02234 family)
VPDVPSSGQSGPPSRAAGPPGPQAAQRLAHREFGIALALGALGACVALLGTREAWAHSYFPAQNPIPGSTVAVTGQDLAPAVAALAIAGLACLAAVIATRRVFRRITGLLLAAFGAGIAVAAATSASGGHVAAAAAAHAPAPYGGAAAHPGAGPRPEITMAAFPWWVVALAGGLLLVTAGVLTVCRGGRWPGMSSRYERPGGAVKGAGEAGGATARDPATVWEALDRGTDPTL